jgi:hypothetical protein
VAAFCAPYIGGTDANRTVKDEIVAVINRRSARRRISVTDLVNPRQRFFERTHPEIQPSAERRQAMMAGSGFHEAFGRAVSTEEYVEQLVEWEGIVGKIDIYEDEPVELKTTASIPPHIFWRPEHVEQLAMYCTMVDRARGHLIYYARAEYGRTPELKAFDLEFTDRGAVATEMMHRRDLLAEALRSGDPTGLPQCTWFGRDCDFAHLCNCAGAVPLPRLVDPRSVRVMDNPLLATRITAALPAEKRGPEITLGDLVFPRKAAFRRAPGEEEEESDARERMKELQRRAFDEALKDAVWYGFPGACRYVRAALGPLPVWVMHFRNVPTVLKTAGWPKEMIDRKRLAQELPYYVDRLGFECAMVERPQGRLILYYPKLPDDKFMVYDFWFKDLAAIRGEMERRRDLLSGGAAPDQLPACQPGWFVKFCPWKDRCGCGPA